MNIILAILLLHASFVNYHNRHLFPKQTPTPIGPEPEPAITQSAATQTL